MSKKRNHRLQRGSAGRRLKQNELDQLWAAYLADRGDRTLRNRLVEHYLPWAHELAASIASRMRLRDRENAVGEVLAAMVASIVPGYDGRGSFTAWAGICVQRMLIDQQRKDQSAEAIFDDSPVKESGEPLDLEEIPAGEEIPAEDETSRVLKFRAVATQLSDRDATILRLRFRRGLSVDAVAEILALKPGTVTSATTRAIAKLQKRFGACSFFATRPY
jgi:RNA polymerase sigma factor (sigma-70 family)